MSKHFVPLLTLAGGGLLAASAQAQSIQADRVITGVSSVTWVGSPPTDDRIFVLEQSQHDVEIFSNTGTPIGKFLDLTGKVFSGSEMGLLSLAFDPDYATNGYVYVYYTPSSNNSRIERYTVDPSNPNLADPTSGHVILEQSQPAQNHNGGNLQFGQDGYLYFAFGDGGGAGDSQCNAQKGSTWLGKMLRIDVHGDDFPADPIKNYAIPADNPYVGDATHLDEIWHKGLRNPWRWHFDPATGDMYIGDVGQDAREEISFAAAGERGLNFGWKIMEGTACFGTGNCPTGVPACGAPELTDPIHDYAHVGFGSRTVIGGVVYRGCRIPSIDGNYFFAEYGANNIWTFRYDPVGGVQGFQDITASVQPAGGSISGPRTFGYDFYGEVLLADSNEVFRFVPTSAPVITDCDGNGKDDGCEIAQDASLDLDGSGGLDVCQGLSADTGTISVSAGGTQAWSLHAGAAYGGDPYFVGGSLSGTAGIPFGAVTIPLTLDGYTLFTLNHPNQPPLLNTFGVLNGSGAASAALAIPGGLLPGSVVGTSVYHAYAVLDGAFLPAFASNFVRVDFVQ